MKKFVKLSGKTVIGGEKGESGDVWGSKEKYREIGPRQDYADGLANITLAWGKEFGGKGRLGDLKFTTKSVLTNEWGDETGIKQENSGGVAGKRLSRNRAVLSIHCVESQEEKCTSNYELSRSGFK